MLDLQGSLFDTPGSSIAPDLPMSPACIVADMQATMTQLNEMLHVHPDHGLALLETSRWFQQLTCEYQQRYRQVWERKAFAVIHDGRCYEPIEMIDGPYWLYLCGGYDNPESLEWVPSQGSPDFSDAHSVGPFSYYDSTKAICEHFNRRKIGFDMYRKD